MNLDKNNIPTFSPYSIAINSIKNISNIAQTHIVNNDSLTNEKIM